MKGTNLRDGQTRSKKRQGDEVKTLSRESTMMNKIKDIKRNEGGGGGME